VAVEFGMVEVVDEVRVEGEVVGREVPPHAENRTALTIGSAELPGRKIEFRTGQKLTVFEAAGSLEVREARGVRLLTALERRSRGWSQSSAASRSRTPS
jgi:hypothetical protein